MLVSSNSILHPNIAHVTVDGFNYFLCRLDFSRILMKRKRVFVHLIPFLWSFIRVSTPFSLFFFFKWFSFTCLEFDKKYFPHCIYNSNPSLIVSILVFIWLLQKKAQASSLQLKYHRYNRHNLGTIATKCEIMWNLCESH